MRYKPHKLSECKLAIILLLIQILTFTLSASTPAQAAFQSALQSAMPPVAAARPVVITPGVQRGRVVIVIVDRLSIGDLVATSMPHFRALLKKGAMGLMNDNTAGQQIPENTYATIGAGAHIAAPGTAALGFNAWEKLPTGTAGEEYRSYTGQEVPAGSLVELGIAGIVRQTRELPYPALPGAIGSALHAVGLKTAALGNADNPSGLQRQVVTVAMDNRGLVDYGDVGDDLLTLDPSFPGGMRTDYEKLQARFAAHR